MIKNLIPSLALKIMEGQTIKIFENITVSDVDSYFLSLKVSVSRGLIGGNFANQNLKSKSVEINSTATELSLSLQSLEFTAPSPGTFLNIVRVLYIFFQY